jgi:lipopolysaccharide biosynthesis glycosyltransferase
MDLHISCSADEAYVAHSATMIHSVLASNPGDRVHVHFLHGPALSGAGLDGVEQLVRRSGGRLHRHEIADERVRGLPLPDRWTAAIWYRIFLPDLLPEVDRVLYLDSDVLAADKLRELFELDLAGAYLGAVTNVLERHWAHHPGTLGLRADAYFNSGVLLLNLDRMRADDASGRVADLARRRAKELMWPDQDALNIVLGEHRLPLHPRWNRMHSLDFPWSAEAYGAAAVEEAKRRPALLHFEGPAANKPWHLLSGPEPRRRYAAHRAQTPWPRYRPDGLTAANLGR